MSTPTLLEQLNEQRAICEEILALSRQETQSLGSSGEFQSFAGCQTRKSILPRLTGCLDKLRRHRELLSPQGDSSRSMSQETMGLIRHNQDLIMRILMIDRQNEQALLRRGLVPPRHIPAASTQRPHFVADLYRRTGLGSANANREDCHR